MNLLTLLGLALKADEVVEILEHFQLNVVYDFDRTHENIDDLYWASAYKQGFELRFNKKQVLDTIFLYAEPRGSFVAIDRKMAGVPFYESFEEAQGAFSSQAVAYRSSPSGRGWIKGTFGEHSVHYEFTNSRLALVTISAVPRV